MREWGPSDYISRREARLKNKRVWMALGAYAVLALLAYVTLEGPFRIVVWLFCGGLTVMTLARAKYGEHESEDSGEKAE